MPGEGITDLTLYDPRPGQTELASRLLSTPRAPARSLPQALGLLTRELSDRPDNHLSACDPARA